MVEPNDKKLKSYNEFVKVYLLVDSLNKMVNTQPTTRNCALISD